MCLCEFEAEDKLRLLPKCSHAFHMDCIDTWLLSHSTCPLCRASLLPDFSSNHLSFSPVVLVLESGGSESAREIASERDCGFGTTNSVARANSHVGFSFRDELGPSHVDSWRKSCEIQAKFPSAAESSRRAFSFRFPVHRSFVAGGEDVKPKSGGGGDTRRTISEIDRRWENEGGGGSELGFDEENQSCNIASDSQPKTPSFARRTLDWLVGKQNKYLMPFVEREKYQMSSKCRLHPANEVCKSIQRIEKRNPRAEAHLPTCTKNKTLFVGQALRITNQKKKSLMVTGSD